MLSLAEITLRWLGRHLLTFVVILAILAAAAFAQKELREYRALAEARIAMQSGKAGLAQHLQSKALEAGARVAGYRTASIQVLDERIRQVDAEILRIAPQGGRSAPDPALCLLSAGAACDKYLGEVRTGAEVELLRQEAALLKALRSTAEGRAGGVELERLRQVHVAAYAKLRSNENAQAAQREASALPVWMKPWSPQAQGLHVLQEAHGQLWQENREAHQAWERQKKVLELIKAPATLREFKVQADLSQLDGTLASLDQAHARHLVTRFSDLVINEVRLALGILLGIILAPLAIKALLYFVIAPLASRRPAIQLLPEVSGAIGGILDTMEGAPDRPKVSAVSQSVTIDAGEELLVHPEYLQSSSIRGTKDTKWLLDWSVPLSSLAAGLFGLTRIRTSSPESFVVSSTTDPLSEIGVIVLPPGSALAMQPHNLVGVVQPRDHPVVITRHWRLGSLSAWLTLQLRYLVFHGPARLVVAGCRGVRVEKSGSGRSINQAATIGFSANLAYRTMRCETFGAYLMGKQELFNDSFGGGPGYYVYEEMPHFGKRGGITGRGLQGIGDSILKVFGI
jgi:hypothetical protein